MVPGATEDETMTKQARIEIRQRLHDSISRSHGGGVTHLVESYTFGPRNWLTAARRVCEIRSDVVRCFGNIGCGSTWAVMVDDVGEVEIGEQLSAYMCVRDAYANATRDERRHLRCAKPPATPADVRADVEWSRVGMEHAAREDAAYYAAADAADAVRSRTEA